MKLPLELMAIGVTEHANCVFDRFRDARRDTLDRVDILFQVRPFRRTNLACSDRVNLARLREKIRSKVNPWYCGRNAGDGIIMDHRWIVIGEVVHFAESQRIGDVPYVDTEFRRHASKLPFWFRLLSGPAP